TTGTNAGHEPRGSSSRWVYPLFLRDIHDEALHGFRIMPTAAPANDRSRRTIPLGRAAGLNLTYRHLSFGQAESLVQRHPLDPLSTVDGPGDGHLAEDRHAAPILGLGQPPHETTLRRLDGRPEVAIPVPGDEGQQQGVPQAEQAPEQVLLH